jgi:L(+)-tartrate dehydratase beta subunit
MAKYGACYLSVTGGAAAVETLQIEEIEQVYWEDLMPECIWQFRFKGFGPLAVGIDAKGRNLQSDVQKRAQEKTAELLRKMGIAS